MSNPNRTGRTSIDPGLDVILSHGERRRAQANYERNNPPGTLDLFADPQIQSLIAKEVLADCEARTRRAVAPKPSPEDTYHEWINGARKDLARLAERMLIDAGRDGVTFDEVRLEAEKRGILTGKEEGRTLSFGAAMMKALGAAPTAYRPSKHPNSHGRTVRVFVGRSFLE